MFTAKALGVFLASILFGMGVGILIRVSKPAIRIIERAILEKRVLSASKR